eukprot:75012-Chlamydomonas_euryale.AAC.3
MSRQPRRAASHESNTSRKRVCVDTRYSFSDANRPFSLRGSTISSRPLAPTRPTHDGHSLERGCWYTALVSSSTRYRFPVGSSTTVDSCHTNSGGTPPPRPPAPLNGEPDMLPRAPPSPPAPVPGASLPVRTSTAMAALSSVPHGTRPAASWSISVT